MVSRQPKGRARKDLDNGSWNEAPYFTLAGWSLLLFLSGQRLVTGKFCVGSILLGDTVFCVGAAALVFVAGLLD
jgi:hypothetical protein